MVNKIALLLLCGNLNNNVVESNILSESLNVDLSTDLIRHEEHPNAEGMIHQWSYNRYKAGDHDSGYFYYDMHLYSTQFTDISKLYLINVKVDFTSGWIATQNNQKGYNKSYDLDRGFVHVGAINRFYDKGDYASSVILHASWPSSSKSTSSITSGFSTSYSGNWTNGAKLSWPNGVEVSTQKNYGFSIEIDYSKTILTDEPYVSTQTSPSNNAMQQWNYQYKGVGKATYVLDTYYLVEVKNDSVGFNQYGFVFDINLNMSNVMRKGLVIFEYHYNQYHNMRLYFNLGRNPEE